jgi:hypothetical protein
MAPHLEISRMKAEGKVHAANVTLTESGEIAFAPGDQYFGEVMRMIGSGIYVSEKKRVVHLDEGSEYLRAIESKFSRSSVWVVDSEDL